MHHQERNQRLQLQTLGFPDGSVVKNPPANVGIEGSIPKSRRSPGAGNSNPLQYSCLGSLMDRGAWEISRTEKPGGLQVHKSRTRVGHDLGLNDNKKLQIPMRQTQEPTSDILKKGWLRLQKIKSECKHSLSVPLGDITPPPTLIMSPPCRLSRMRKRQSARYNIYLKEIYQK